MANHLNTYRLSGEFSPFKLLTAIVLTALLAFPLSFAYAYTAVYLRVLVLSIVLSLIYIGGLALFYKALAKRYLTRNNLALTIGATLVAGIALYIAWTSFIFVLANKLKPSNKVEYFNLLTHPQTVWFFITKYLIPYGWFSIKGSIVKGAFYAIALSLEALSYFAIAIYLGRILPEEVFCERCNKWGNVNPLLATVSISMKEPISKTVKTKNLSWIDQLEFSEEYPLIRLDGYTCPSCGQLNLLTAKEVKMIQKKKETAFKEKNIFTNLIVTREIIDKISQQYEKYIDKIDRQYQTSTDETQSP